jgi:hypothetical protein
MAIETRRLEGQMKLSELKPCACCSGPLLTRGIIQWYVLRQTMAMLKPQDTNRVLGLTQFFQGSIALAEAFETSKPVTILGDCEPELMTEIHICFNCWISNKFDAVRPLFEAEAEK